MKKRKPPEVVLRQPSTFRLTREQHDAVHALATAMGVSISEIYRQAIRRYLEDDNAEKR